MPSYFYTATSLNGEKTSGTEVAKSERELASLLHGRGYVLTHASVEGAEKKRTFNILKTFSNFFGVPLSEKLVFTRNLQVMVSAGIALPKALEILSLQTENQTLRGALVDVKEQVLKGQALSESMRAHPRIFSELFINMIEAAEEAGTMEDVLSHLSLQIERDYEIRSKVKGALVYPSVIVTAMIGIGAFMLAFVVPKLAETFVDLDVELPLMTRIVVTLGNFFAAWWFVIFPVFLVLLFGLFRLSRTKRGRKVTDAIFLRLPIISGIVRKTNTAITARTLSSLLAAGVPIVRSLEVTSHVVSNWYFGEALAASAEDVKKGEKLSQSLKAYQDIYPLMIVQMIQVGEETGETTSILRKLAEFFEGEVDNVTKNLTSIIEPVLMLVIGGVVGLFAISMFQPIYSLVGNLQ